MKRCGVATVVSWGAARSASTCLSRFCHARETGADTVDVVAACRCAPVVSFGVRASECLRVAHVHVGLTCFLVTIVLLSSLREKKKSGCGCAV